MTPLPTRHTQSDALVLFRTCGRPDALTFGGVHCLAVASLAPSLVPPSLRVVRVSPPPRRLRRLAPAGRSSLASGTVRSPSHGCGCLLFTVVNLFARPWFWASMPPCDALLLLLRTRRTRHDAPEPRVRFSDNVSMSLSRARASRFCRCTVTFRTVWWSVVLACLLARSAGRSGPSAEDFVRGPDGPDRACLACSAGVCV